MSYSEKELLERKLVRKLDIRLLPYLSWIYLLCFLDRVNIGYAKVYGLITDLKLQPYQFPLALSVFFIAYVIFEVPSNLLLKRFSAPKWICRIMVTWGIVTALTALVTDGTGLIICRFFVGMSEAGMFPGIIYYLSFWYTRKEQGMRVASFFSFSSLAGAFSGLIAYAISFIKSDLKTWQWIFIIEGIPSIVFGVITWFYLPTIPDEAKWLTEEERELAVSRLKYNFVNSGDKSFKKDQVKEALTDYKVYLYMIIYFGFACPLITQSILLPTIVQGLDLNLSPSNALLLSVPPFVFAFIITIITGKTSDYFMDRGLHIIGSSLFAIIGFILLLTLNNPWVKYAGLTFVVVGASSCLPLTLSWASNNMVGSTKTATATAMIVSFGNLGGIVSGQFYQPTEAPNYIFSHSMNLSLFGVTIIAAAILRTTLWLQNRNKMNKSLELEVDCRDDDIKTKDFYYVL